MFSKVNHAVPPNWPDVRGLNTAHDLYVVNADGTGLRRLTRPGPISIVPDWHGELIVFDERSEQENYQGASVVQADGTDRVPRRMMPGAKMPRWIPPRSPRPVQQPEARAPNDTLPRWEGLLVCSEAGPHRSHGSAALFTVRPDGTERRHLTAPTGRDVYPAWSRDGRKIAFASHRSGVFELCVMDADGSHLRQLTSAPENPRARARWVNAVPAWSPDGRFILFETGRSGIGVETWLMNADGSAQRGLLDFPYGAGRLPWRGGPG